MATAKRMWPRMALRSVSAGVGVMVRVRSEVLQKDKS
jgi:hypothetical protein